MSTLQDSDLFVVDRSGINYKLPNSQMSTVQDTDLFVVERDGVNYKVEGKDVAGPGGFFDQPVSVLTPLNGAGLNAGQSYQPLSSTLVSSSSRAATVNFSTTVYAGTGVTNVVSTGVDNTDKSLVWIKARDGTESNALFDTVRGVNELLQSDKSNAETLLNNGLMSFSDDGFTVLDSGVTNNGSLNYVAWNFRAAPGFMDIVTYTGSGSGSGTKTISHNLGSVPGVIIAKGINGGSDWAVYHKGLNGGSSPEDWYLALNHSFPQSDAVANWGGTAPTATEFTVGGNINSTLNHVVYLFADTPGLIKCGSYTASGAFTTVDVGFKPAFMLIKSSTQSSNWGMLSSRDENLALSNKYLEADSANQEGSVDFDFTATGVSINELNSNFNTSGQTYIYVAIADTPDVDPALDLTFLDNTELAKIIGPVRMVDVNGDVKTPVTSAVTNTTQLAGPKYFSATLYAGNSGSQTVVTDIDNTDKALVWVKATDTSSFNHFLYDTLRRVSPDKSYSWISSNNANEAQDITVTQGGLAEFTNKGFVFDASYAGENQGGFNYVAWNFRAAPGFMDVVTFEGTGGTPTEPQQVPHSLGVAPGCIIVKGIDTSDSWFVYHKDAGYYETDRWAIGLLNDSAAFNNYGGISAEPFQTATYFSVEKTAGFNYVAYLFADTPGLIKCGSYTGGSNGQTISTGFKTGWVLIKSSNGSENWNIYDAKRNAFLYPNLTNQESPDSFITFGADGFTLTTTNNSVNGSGLNYVYVAIAEDAGASDITSLTLTDNKDLEFFSPGDAVTGPAGTPTTADVFSTTLYTGNGGSEKVINLGVDLTTKGMSWVKTRSFSDSHHILDSVRGDCKNLTTNDTSKQNEDCSRLNRFTSESGGRLYVGSDFAVNKGGETYVAWNFRAAPQFMDIVKYSGDGVSGRSIPHQLSSTPGLMILKSSSEASDWLVYHKDIGYEGFLVLNSSNEEYPYSNRFTQNPDSSVFYVGGQGLNVNNTGQDYVAYLFADTPGNIKCGKFPAEETTTVDLGFEPGWILVKTTNTTGAWYVFDSARGISASVSSNAGLRLSADTDAQEYNQSGLWVESSSPTVLRTDLNFSTANCIYVAIAKDATADIIPPKPSGEVVSSDPSGPTLELSNVSGTWKNGDIATGPILNTVSNNVIDQSGNTLTVTDTTGNWLPGLHAQGAEITEQAPSPESIVFTSMNDGTTPVTGVDATLARRKWTLEKSDSASGPWVVVGIYNDSAANASQDGATPWGNPPLEPNTFYQVKVMYESGNAEPVESLYNTFRTGDA